MKFLRPSPSRMIAICGLLLLLVSGRQGLVPAAAAPAARVINEALVVDEGLVINEALGDHAKTRPAHPFGIINIDQGKLYLIGGGVPHKVVNPPSSPPYSPGRRSPRTRWNYGWSA